MATSGPTVWQRELDTPLRELRPEYSLTVEEVEAEIMCSATKISRIETRTRRLALCDVRDLCTLYGVEKSAADEFMDLGQGAREQEWWRQYEDLMVELYLWVQAGSQRHY